MCAIPARCTTCRFCLAVLTASGQLEDVPADAAFLGQLALDGTLRPVSGVLPMALAAEENGTHALYVPAENAAEAAEACADSMAVDPAHTAREVVDALRGISRLARRLLFPLTCRRMGTGAGFCERDGPVRCAAGYGDCCRRRTYMFC